MNNHNLKEIIPMLYSLADMVFGPGAQILKRYTSMLINNDNGNNRMIYVHASLFSKIDLLLFLSISELC